MEHWDIAWTICDKAQFAECDIEDSSVGETSFIYQDIEILFLDDPTVCMEKELLYNLLRGILPPPRPNNREWLHNLAETLSQALLIVKYNLNTQYFDGNNHASGLREHKVTPTLQYTDIGDAQFQADTIYYTDLLKLKDWDIVYKILEHGKRLMRGKAVGTNAITQGQRKSTIRLLREPDVIMEEILVHELLHLVFPMTYENEKGYWLHRLIVLIAEVILTIRYGLDEKYFSTFADRRNKNG
jgi:hypothetical protein